MQFVPNHYRHDRELCLAAINQNAMALRYVEDPTFEMCMIAVEKDGMMLQYIDGESRYPEICEAAVKQNRDALQFVPPHLRNQVLQPYRDMGNYKVSGFATKLSEFASNLPAEIKRTPEVTPNGVKPGGPIHQYLGWGRKSRKRTSSRRR